MNTKTFIVAGLVGGIVDWRLGWLFYGIILSDYFPQPNDTMKTMVCIFAGCMAFGFFMSYIFNKWAQISTASTGLKAGAVIGFFMGSIANLFDVAFVSGITYKMFTIDLLVSIVLAALVGLVIGAISGKLNKRSD